MKKISFFLLIITVLGISFSSCHNEKPTITGPSFVKFSFNPLWHDDQFVMQQVYNDNYGNRLRVDRFMNYVSMFTLVKDDGTEVLMKDFSLFDFFNENAIEGYVPEGKYTSLKFNLGIPSAYNKDQDPAQYPSSSPLSVAGSQGMFWGWNTGYIFAKFEGKCDTTGTEGAELLWPVSIHSGDDACFKQYESQSFSLVAEAGKRKEININIHVDQILMPGNGEDIDLATDAITHTSTNEQLAKKYMTNYINAIEVVQ